MDQYSPLPEEASIINKNKISPLQHKIRQIRMDRWLYIFMLPGLIYFILFKYVPMWGVLLAFKNYNPYIGFLKSQWVGILHFQRFFSEPAFGMLMRNTIMLGIFNLFFYFPIPIILALLLNEVRRMYFKCIIQTIVYLPHFLSWVIIVGISYVMLTTEGGVVNDLIVSLGGEKIRFLLSEKLFGPVYIGQIIWKEAGWGTIIFLAALASVEVEMYEAAIIDGANRFQQLLYITLPSIKSTIVILLILRLGNFLDTGFEHIYLMMNPMNRKVAEVFDTYVFENGIQLGNYSYSTAVGLFKSVVGLVLVTLSNRFAKKIGEEGIF